MENLYLLSEHIVNSVSFSLAHLAALWQFLQTALRQGASPFAPGRNGPVAPSRQGPEPTAFRGMSGPDASEPDLNAKPFPAAALAELLELTARKLHSRGYAEDLFPAQWTALRYFARARPEMRTASELARFQGMANGPVSRTVRTLVQKGLLAKAALQPKGRAEQLEVTDRGSAVLARDPTLALQVVLADLPPAQQEALALALENVLRRLPETALEEA